MKRTFLFISMILMLIGCSQKVTGEVLIEGNWIGTSGYEDGEAEGDPNCYPFHEGIEFKDEETVYVETYERDFEYWLRKNINGFKITFFDSKPGIYSYEIKMISEDEVVLEGLYSREGHSCIMERK